MAFVTSTSSIFFTVTKNSPNPNPTSSSSSSPLPSPPSPPVAGRLRSRPRGPSPPAAAFGLVLSLRRSWLGFDTSQVDGKIGGRCRVLDEEAGEDAEMALEAEIYEFMQRSGKPSDFPTKDQLIAAGKMDLVRAIAAHGGWLALGWDLEEKNVWEQEQEEDFSNSSSVWTSKERSAVQTLSCRQDDGNFQNQRFRDTTTSSSLEAAVIDDSDHVSSSSSASSSGRSIEAAGREDAGIDGILSRLEKERNISFAVGSGDKSLNGRVYQGYGENHQGLMVGGSERCSRSLSLDTGGDLFYGLGDLLHPQNEGFSNSGDEGVFKQMSSVQCSGFPMSEFEDTGIIPNGNGKSMHGRSSSDISVDYDIQDRRNKLQFETEENCQNQLWSRIQHLESELSSTLSLLRSRSNAAATHEDQPSSLKEFRNLSDAWELKENEIMNSRDKLRSMRAKMAVLEGKMALELIEARKAVEEKQKKIDAVQKALRLLRTACVVWPNSALEVLLTGSFDGWTSQRRMERSSTGVFSLYLKLYPGRYEIKFIVDGVWTVDPLRPIVHSNGYENNLLLVS